MIKSKIAIDDVLDVASLQAIPGMTGSILLAFFATTNVLPCPLPQHYMRHCDRSLLGREGVFYGGGGYLLKWQLVTYCTTSVHLPAHVLADIDQVFVLIASVMSEA